ncbi:hypothetical protein REPUB_Repub18cG0032300 [Reevesia pubescens]
MECHLASTVFYTLILLTIMKLTFATDTLTPAQSIVDGETLVSSSQNFELGFFSPGKYSKNRFLGIWYKNIPGPVLWVANRNRPLTGESGLLTISGDGNLVLLDGGNRTMWSSIVSRKAEAPVAQLLDSGNFVLKENLSLKADTYLWQSFDYPSDTILPGMKLGKNLKTGLEWYLSSWKNVSDPSSGNFTYRLEIHGLPYLVVSSGLSKRFRTGPWNGLYFGGVPTVPNLVFEPILVHNHDEIYYMYESFNNPIITRLSLNPSGSVQRFVWNERSSEWTVIFTAPPNECNNYGQCGVNSVCSISNSSTATCECLMGFIPELLEGQHMESHSWPNRCVRQGLSNCNNGEFLKLDGIKLPDLIDFSLNESMNLEECEVSCSKNCSCKGYASVNLSRPDSGCLMWFGDLIDVSKMSGERKESDFYIRVPSSEQGSAINLNGKRRKLIIMVIATVPGVIILTMVLCFLWKQWIKGQKSKKENAEIHLFDLAAISIATKNFSQENLVGAGGFGSVYKGILPTGQEIAVKRLSNSSGQGVEEFRNEVILIAKLQHRNLVGLCGSCIQGEERLLIYEYMPNKSLDYFIFDNNRRVLLAWKKRFVIVIQIVRGLLYLHQDSKLHIVHRDLKPSNILLDTDWNPKISDFGLARIFEGDDKVSETKRVVGTFGYMSPEYAVKGIFSVKSDVFSLGVLLLEIVSGKKNRNFCHPDHHYNLLGHAWLLWNEGRALELVDTCLKDSIVESQVLRCIQVGLLCVQNFPQDRPTMSSVNFMLAKEEAILPHPKEPGFFTENSSNADEELPTVNVVSITMLGGR